ncbi:MAG: MarR family transcriptional regulator [Gammaproteobacteria bacterium]|nr:MarR family transcriptional regulator [Gammaproteobacteria bacterium]
MTESTGNSASRGKESLRLWLRLLSCETVLEQRVRTLFRQHFEVTLPQFDVLSELERADRPLTMSQLSKELMVSNGNVTGVIDRLSKNNLVRRVRSREDRRIQYIELTDEGRREFRLMAKKHEGWIRDLLAELPLDDMRQLQELLLRTRRAIAAAGH